MLWEHLIGPWPGVEVVRHGAHPPGMEPRQWQVAHSTMCVQRRVDTVDLYMTFGITSFMLPVLNHRRIICCFFTCETRRSSL